ncbi:YeiH family protein [Phytoactinopolyspora mesophila]|uniref:YeiH family protein n=1 Tax=Phytoactinopolyspora mesophila TaxID=2650750 RepID=UPI001C9E522F
MEPIPGEKPAHSSVWPGLAFVAAGVAVAFAVNHTVPVSVLMIALALGAVATNTGMVGAALRPGLAFAARQLLRTGVVLLGLQLALPEVLALGPRVLTLVIVSVAVTYAGTLVMGRALGLSAERSLLIATGFSICGASAVAAARSVVNSDDEDVATGIALVTIFGTLSIVIMPALYMPLGLDPTSFGIWAGASVHEVAQVVAVAGTVGASALAPAVVVKLTRVVLLAPLVAGMSLWQRRRAGQPVPGWRPPIVPVFVLGFLLAMAVRSADVVPGGLLELAATAQTMLLAAAMFGMGAAVHLRTLIRGGGPSLLLGLLSTLLISTVSGAGLMLL